MSLHQTTTTKEGTVRLRGTTVRTVTQAVRGADEVRHQPTEPSRSVLIAAKLLTRDVEKRLAGRSSPHVWGQVKGVARSAREIRSAMASKVKPAANRKAASAQKRKAEPARKHKASVHHKRR